MKKEKNPAAVALGSIKTEKKAKSSRENGKKGGRKKKLLAIIVGLVFIPQITFAAISESQANAILAVLQAFGVDQITITNVRNILIPTPVVGGIVTTTVTQGTLQDNWRVVAEPVREINQAPMDLSGIDIEFTHKDKPEVGNPYGAYNFYMYVKGADGETIKNAPVEWEVFKDGVAKPFSYNNYKGVAKTNSGENINGNTAWKRSITVVPQETGQYVLKTKSGSLTKDYIINVE